MPGTNTNYDITSIRAGLPGQLWANLAIPGAGASLTLAADGTPDAAANPNAKHLGMTKEGAELILKATFEKFFIDEFRNPVHVMLSGSEAMIKASLAQVMDMELFELLTPGVGTKTAGTGFERVTFGQRDIVYTSIAHIFPLTNDPTKFGVWQIYKCYNNEGAGFKVGAKIMSEIPVSFEALDIPSRAKADTLGQYFKQV